MSNKILMVVTNGYTMKNGELAGIWLTEFSEAYLEFTKNGYDVTVASPKGGESQIDPRSLQGDVPEEDQKAGTLLTNTLPLSNIKGADEFIGIFFPGGHGTMFDFPENEHIHKLLTDFANQDKIIAAVCHGPAALVGGVLANGQPLVKGKRMTAFTNEEEVATTLDKYMPFLLESKLRELGGSFVAEPNWSDHVEVDGKLITGQNPQSTISVAKAFIAQLA
ncbi:type 1 glutamine amidotransferase domain-containing protein [Ectobacillus sp. sgz5001026]|uniref:type 1 glutamine amidotransferase domain-containing protein n=1 Tax=Ectobacillus sp. sgz5001026 TaxID=3242473 RepID=UPI0036D2ACEE